MDRCHTWLQVSCARRSSLVRTSCISLNDFRVAASTPLQGRATTFLDTTILGIAAARDEWKVHSPKPKLLRSPLVGIDSLLGLA